MRRVAVWTVLVLLVAACGGSEEQAGGGSDQEGSGSEEVREDESSSESGDDAAPEGDGTRLFVPGVLGGVDVVDLEAETQETFVEGEQGVYAISVAGDTLWFVEGTDLVAADARSGEVRARTTFPDTVADYVVSGDTVLVLVGIIGASTELSIVDAIDLGVSGTASAPDGTRYSEPVSAGGSVWAFGGSLELGTALARIDPDTATQIDVHDTGIIADSVIAGDGAIWVGGTIPSFDGSTAPSTGIARIDPGSGEVTQTIDLGEPARTVELHLAFGSLWATTGVDGVLFRLDPATGELLGSVVTEDGAAGVPNTLSATDELIWVYNRTAGTMEGYDPDTLEFDTGITVPFGAGQPVFAP